MTVVRCLLISLLSVMTISCSYFSASSFLRNKNDNYLAARSIPPLKIPPGVASSTIQTYYPVSYRNYPPSALDVNLTPPGLMGEPA